MRDVYQVRSSSWPDTTSWIQSVHLINLQAVLLRSTWKLKTDFFDKDSPHHVRNAQVKCFKVFCSCLKVGQDHSRVNHLWSVELSCLQRTLYKHLVLDNSLSGRMRRKIKSDFRIQNFGSLTLCSWLHRVKPNLFHLLQLLGCWIVLKQSREDFKSLDWRG